MFLVVPVDFCRAHLVRFLVPVGLSAPRLATSLSILLLSDKMLKYRLATKGVMGDPVAAPMVCRNSLCPGSELTTKDAADCNDEAADAIPD